MNNNEVYIGSIAVDSGQMMLCDPCYIDSSWKKNDVPADFTDLSMYRSEFSYLGAAEATLSEKSAGVLSNGYAGLGAVCSTGWGDGMYPVYVVYNDEGRIAEMRIEFISEHEDDEFDEDEDEEFDEDQDEDEE